MPDTHPIDRNKTSGLEMVFMRNTFYRDGYRMMLFCIVLIAVIDVFLSVCVYVRFAHPVQAQYFATTADGRIIKVHPLQDPSVPDDFVLQWTADSIHQAFTLDFVHWREQLQNASSNFTPEGWNYFTDSLNKSDNLRTILDLKMISNAEVTGSPQIVQTGVVNGHYAWNIKMPMLITYRNSSNRFINQPVDVHVIVVREPVENYPQKIAINNVFIAQIDSSAFK